MSTFSSLLSSLNGQDQASVQLSSTQHRTAQTGLGAKNADGIGAGAVVAAGVKRKSEEPEVNVRLKAVKVGQVSSAISTTPTGSSKRFQLSSKPGVTQRYRPVSEQPATKIQSLPNAKEGLQKAVQNTNSTPVSRAVTANGAGPAKRGFASIMEKAKAAQAAARVAGPTSIKHKPVEKISKRDRLRMIQEASAERKAAGSGGSPSPVKRTTSVAGKGAAEQITQQESSSRRIKKSVAAISYRGTMRSASAGNGEMGKQKERAKVRNGGNAEWSEIVDAEDEDEEDYDSYASSDMEGGFDDLEEEETAALRAAQREDREALEEEERLRRDKAERRRKLQLLNNSAAAKKRF